MNLPNSITVGRIFLVPLLVVVLLTKFDGREWFGISNEMLGAAIFGVASVTDWLDGYLARRRAQITEFGQWMDPLADKLLVTGALISLVQNGVAPAWMVAVLLGRELTVTVLRSIVYARGQTLPASPIGKVKMVAEVTAILLLILGQRPLAQFLWVGVIALWVATAAALVSAVDYWRQFNALLNAKPAAAPASMARAETRAEPEAARKRVSA